MSSPSEQQLGEEETVQVWTMLRQDLTRILLPYVNVDLDHWMLFFNWEECFTALCKGEDQRSWDRLIASVEGNNAKKAACDE